MLLECEPTDFTQLVKEAAARSPQFSATLVQQVLGARHAGASSGRLLAECEKLIAAAADKHHSGRNADSPRLGGSGDGGGAVEAYDKLWSQLRNTERVAAASLGWDAASCVSVAAPCLVLALPHCVVAVTDGTAGAQCAQRNGAL